MSYIEILVLAYALSVDAFAVSFSYGLVFTQNKVKNSLNLALFTGTFQGIMPLSGYFLTNLVKIFIEPYAKYIVFLIFIYLGVKFILEAFEKERQEKLCIDLKCLFLIGIATSIDAFSAGITLSLCGNGIIKPAILTAFVTFANSIAGFCLGSRFKNKSTKILEILSGLLLILLGVKAVFY